MTFIIDPDSPAHAVLVLALVAGLGQVFGSLKWRGLGLGIAGVLFAGLVFGHLGVAINDDVLDFVRNFGLILFVYAIGLQVGPGFFSSLRREGLPLNLMAAAIVTLGAGIAVLAHYWGGVSGPAAVGILSGATTNTPSLGAAQQALLDFAGPDAEVLKLPGTGYAAAYPLGVLGIIGSILAIKGIFRIPVAKELSDFSARAAAETPPLHTMNIEVTNADLAGIPLGKMPGAPEKSIVVSRLWREGRVIVPAPETRLAVGDILLAVGSREMLEHLRTAAGRESPMDLHQVPSGIGTRRVVVTRREVLGKTIESLHLSSRFGVTITRLSRIDLEFAAAPHLTLKFGDSVLMVGPAEAIREAAKELGNSPRQLNDPQIIALLLGIALGVFIGSVPIPVPGLPVPVRLGLAGGPLIAAIALARIGKIGRLVWHMPISANYMMRELGISLFLACVGLRAGTTFVSTVMSPEGVEWVLWGAAITFVPLLTVGIFARAVYKVNYTALAGLLAGANTSPPALSFSSAYIGSEYPALSYAAVYPLTMLLRVLSTQVLILFLR